MDARTKALRDPATGNFAVGSLLFYADSTIGDAAIRIATGSYWSHCAVATGDGNRIESWQGVGVRKGPGDFLNTAGFAARPLPGGNVAPFMAILEAQLGKPYDILAWLAVPLSEFGIRLGGGPPRAFDCSSFIAYAADAVLAKWLRVVTPQQIYNWANDADPTPN